MKKLLILLLVSSCTAVNDKTYLDAKEETVSLCSDKFIEASVKIHKYIQERNYDSALYYLGVENACYEIEISTHYKNSTK